MSQSTYTSKSPLLIKILLLLIILVAAFLRFYNLRWDARTFPHPDERSTLLFYAPTIRFPANTDDLLDPRQSPLNPFWDVSNQTRRSYTYGHFPLYLLVATNAILVDLAPKIEPLTDNQALIDFFYKAESGFGYADVGRGWVAFFDILSVVLIFLITRRIYGDWAGLLAAALSAFAVFHIQLAHFFAVDPVSTTFTLLTVYASIKLYERATLPWAILAGVAIGLAVSSKYSALPVVLVPATANLLLVLKPSPLVKEKVASLTGQAFTLLITAAIFSFVTFALTSPFVLLDYENFEIAVVQEQGNMVRGLADFPFTRQYRNTLPYLYFIEQQIRWGLGWPLGLLAFLGMAWAGGQAFRGKLEPGGWLILAWVIPYFAITGLFLAKFMRYMSPVTPFAIIFGAGLLTALARRLTRPVAVGLGLVVLAGTIVWAGMFVNGVYATDHPWVSASRWIYQNVPDGSCIAREHWEEGVPMGLQEPGMSSHAHGYFQPQLPMYDPDTEQKFYTLRDTLRNCQYLVIASNRMLRTLPNLPQRYPMSSRYYEALFNEDLGYKLATEFSTPPRLGSFTLDDQPADESFTVYDHPKAYIFEKTHDLTDAEWFAVLGNTWQGAQHGYLGRPTLWMWLDGQGPNADLSLWALLTGNDSPPDGNGSDFDTWLDEPISTKASAYDWRWNTLANQSPLFAIFCWWLAVQVIGLVVFPISFALFHRLRDRGYLLSKSLGLLLVSYMVWLMASLGLPTNRLPIIVAVLGGMAVLGVILAWIQRNALKTWGRANLLYLLIGEGLFLFVFLFFVLLRIGNPDLWQPWNGGEKMLEIGFLNAIVRSATMPPYDPFLAGAYINYYYYGMFIVGILIKLTGITPTVAFNLAVPMLAALTALNVFNLSTNLALSLGARTSHLQAGQRPALPGFSTPVVGTGLLAVLFVVFISNVDGLGQIIRNLADISTLQFESAIPGLEILVRAGQGLTLALDGVSLKAYNYWHTSRIIPFTINEFPYWSFLFADLHPHMMVMPFSILFLNLAYNWYQSTLGRKNEEDKVSEVGETENPLLFERGRGEGEFSRPNQPTITLDEQLGLPEEHQPPQREGVGGGLILADEPIPSSQTFFSLLRTEYQSIRAKLSLASILRWLFLPFILGALAAINTWDLPTYLGLMLAVVVMARYRLNLHPLTWERGFILLGEGLLFTGAVLLLSQLFYRPFFANYHTLDVGVSLVKDKIEFTAFLKVWGFFLFIIVTWLWLEIRHPQTRFAPLRAIGTFTRHWAVSPHLAEIYQVFIKKPKTGYMLTILAFGLLLLLAFTLALLKAFTLALSLFLLVPALYLLLRWDSPTEQSFIELLTFTGILLLLGIQIVFLRDFLGGGDHYLMNTYFKFFIQVWVLFGISTAVMVARLWQKAEQWALGWRWLWRGIFIILIFASTVFLVLGTRSRLDNRFPEAQPEIGTLDGMAYMEPGVFSWENVTYTLSYEQEALTWMLDNVEEIAVVAEARVGYYREWGMRVAAYTGLPSVLGGLHQNEQHPPEQIGERSALVNQFWFAPTEADTLRLIDELDITYIYVGQLERALYGEGIKARFDALAAQGALAVVFENAETSVYRVR